MKSNSFAHGCSNSHGNSAYNGTGPAALTITGARLGGEHWWDRP